MRAMGELDPEAVTVWSEEKEPLSPAALKETIRILVGELERLHERLSDRYGNTDCVPVSATSLREWARCVDDEEALGWVAGQLREAANGD
jgi:hypothetical protein